MALPSWCRIHPDLTQARNCGAFGLHAPCRQLRSRGQSDWSLGPGFQREQDKQDPRSWGGEKGKRDAERVEEICRIVCAPCWYSYHMFPRSPLGAEQARQEVRRHEGYHNLELHRFARAGFTCRSRWLCRLGASWIGGRILARRSATSTSHPTVCEGGTWRLGEVCE